MDIILITVPQQANNKRQLFWELLHIFRNIFELKSIFNLKWLSLIFPFTMVYKPSIFSIEWILLCTTQNVLQSGQAQLASALGLPENHKDKWLVLHQVLCYQYFGIFYFVFSYPVVCIKILICVLCAHGVIAFSFSMGNIRYSALSYRIGLCLIILVTCKPMEVVWICLRQGSLRYSVSHG